MSEWTLLQVLVQTSLLRSGKQLRVLVGKPLETIFVHTLLVTFWLKNSNTVATLSYEDINSLSVADLFNLK
jgi:hypothetical protein